MSTHVWPNWLPLRADLRQMSPYGAPQVPAEATLNTNENPYSPSPELIAAITERVGRVASTLNRYPDRDAVVLRKSLASFINELSGTSFTDFNIWAANGSNEVIQTLFLAFGSKPALGFTPSYSMHPLIAKVTGVTWIDGKRRDDFGLDIDLAVEQIHKTAPGLTFVTTPNNPTGNVVTLDEISQLAKATQEVGGLLIVDEAYAEFSTIESAVTLIKLYPHLVVIRTMSKAFAFAGARLGYLVASPEVVEAMFLVRLPYHLSALTQAAAEVALEYRGELLGTVAQLIDSRKAMVADLEAMGFDVIPSQANFILFSGFSQSAPQVWQMALDRGVLIRDVGLSGYLRVTVGNEAENQKFLQVMKDIRNGEKR
jgi:histidinol-phosphate aminotransferase